MSEIPYKFTTEQIVASQIVTQMMLIRLAVRTGEDRALIDDLNKIHDHAFRNGIDVSGGLTLTQEQYPELFKELESTILAITIVLDQWGNLPD